MVPNGEGDGLAIIWSSGDAEVALKVCFMYALNAKVHGWFDEVVLVIWGPSARVASGDAMVQRELASLKRAGVLVQACKECADSYGLSTKLEALSVEVKYMGLPLKEMLHGGWKVLTF